MQSLNGSRMDSMVFAWFQKHYTIHESLIALPLHFLPIPKRFLRKKESTTAC